MRVIIEDPDLQKLLAKIGSVSPKQAGVIDGIGLTKVHELIRSGDYESYLEGSSRRITLRSMIARRERLLAEAKTSPPPPRRGLTEATAASLTSRAKRKRDRPRKVRRDGTTHQGVTA
jgi:hypothetical protein